MTAMKPKMMPSASMVILLFPQGLEVGGARFKRGMGMGCGGSDRW